jgi:predicted nucleic acid-binding protein
VYTPKQPKPGLFAIRDEKDYPVLYSAITESIDIFVTGDKDFDGLNLERPEIITAAGFLEKFC